MTYTIYDMIKDDHPVLRTGNRRLIDKGKYEEIGFFLDITTRCNKNCKFCSYKQIPGKDISEEILEQVYTYFRSVLDYYSGNMKVILFGGEPTINKKCFDIIHNIRNLEADTNKLRIELQSNLSQSVDYYVELLKHIEHLTLTWHIDQQNSIFFEKIKQLADKADINKSKIEIFVMFSNFSYQSSYDFKKKLDDIGIYSELHYIKINEQDIDPIAEALWHKDSENYVEENILLINGHRFGYEEWFDKVFPFHMPKIKCYAGYQQQYIDVDGNIYRCDTKHLKKESFGHVKELRPPFDLDIVCENENCHRDWTIRKEIEK